MKSEKERILWIDLCKAISIFVMVFLHVGSAMPAIDKQLDNSLHLWHVPIFYMLSGLVLNGNKYILGGGKNTLHKVETLLIPYFIFAIILCTICYITISIIGNSYSEKDFTLTDIFLSIFWINNQNIPFGAVQWFLTSLFFTEFFFVLIARIIGTNKKTMLLYVTIAILGIAKIRFSEMILPWSLDTIFFSLPFYAFGYLFKDDIMKAKCKNPLVVIVILSMLVASYCLSDYYGINVRGSWYKPSYILIVSFFLCLGVIYIVRFFEKSLLWLNYKMKNLIIIIGQETLLILLLNAFLRKGVKIMPFISDNYWYLLFMQVLSSIGIILLILIVGKIVKRYVPWMLGKF